MGILSPRKALDEARKCGFHLKTDGVSLKLTAKEKPSQYLLDALKLHKAEIIKMMIADAGLAWLDLGPCFKCGQPATIEFGDSTPYRGQVACRECGLPIIRRMTPTG